MCQVQCYAFSHMLAEFTLVRILFKRYDSCFTDKKQKWAGPRSMCLVTAILAQVSRTQDVFGPPASIALHHWSSPLYKNNVRCGGVGIVFSKMNTFIRLSHLLSYDLYFRSLSSTYCLFWIQLELWREIKHIYPLTSQFLLKRKWSKLSKPFLSCLIFVSKRMLAIDICLGWAFCYHSYNF